MGGTGSGQQVPSPYSSRVSTAGQRLVASHSPEIGGRMDYSANTGRLGDMPAAIQTAVSVVAAMSTPTKSR
jgi:hypothetical protein